LVRRWRFASTTDDSSIPEIICAHLRHLRFTEAAG
jgi:hypothetical protein